MTNTQDFRVTPTQSFKLYHALRDNGVPTKFIAYPIYGHNAGSASQPPRRHHGVA